MEGYLGGEKPKAKQVLQQLLKKWRVKKLDGRGKGREKGQ